jgi:hypothetical protein
VRKWKVQIKDGYEEELVAIFKNLTNEEETIIYKWINFVEKNGPYSLNEFKGFDVKNHELTRQIKWKDCFSSSFSKLGRIIYRIHDDVVIVEVIKITANHDYS